MAVWYAAPLSTILYEDKVAQKVEGQRFRPSSYRLEQFGSYFLDPTGQTTLRAAGPEERVRQQFVKFLTDRLGVPLRFLTTEDAVSHHGSASRQRMDICGLTAEGHPLFVVECKRQGLVLEERNRHQVRSYVKKVGAKVAILTNGDETHVYISDPNDRDLRKLQLPANTVPTYQEMLKLGDYDLDFVLPSVYCRPPWEDLPDSTEGLRDEPFASMISTESETGRVRWLASLGSLLLDAHGFRQREWPRRGLHVKDMGTAYVNPTNRSGGSWAGEYRGFLVTQRAVADPHMVRFYLTVGVSQAKRPKAKTYTTLVVAVDDKSGKTRNQLQLNTDFRDTVEQLPKTAIIRHNGKLTGEKGWTKDALINYAREHAPHLVEGQYVRLGSLPVTRHVEWRDAHDFITNCIEYALLRKRFKERVREG